MINTSFSLCYNNRCPRAPGPDDTSDPDFPSRDHGSPAPTWDSCGSDGPDGPIDYPEYL